MKAKDIAAITRTLELLEASPPKGESWYDSNRDGPTLGARLRSWLKEQL
ncbi:hypothetical protein [Mycobacterium phage WXIN]|nr:hypothetical protein [Mycobacterium phage WXIN]